MTMPKAVSTVWHAWPGRDRRQEPLSNARDRWSRYELLLTMVILPELGALPQRLGLGAFLLSAGASEVDAGIVVADNLPQRAPSAFEALEAWASAHPIETPIGPKPRRVMPAAVFNRDLLIGAGYRGRALIGSADRGRSFGLLAEHWVPSRGANRGGWTVWLSGCGSWTTWEVTLKHGRVERRHGWRPERHLPPLYLKARGELGLSARWGSLGEGEGRWEKGKRPRAYPGRFVDLIAAASALDGDESGDLIDHLEVFGLTGVEPPTAVLADNAGAERVTALVSAMRELALRLDEELELCLGA